MNYKCEKCGLIGTGIPLKTSCPNCKSELEIKIKDAEDKISTHGSYVTVSYLVETLNSLPAIFKSFGCEIVPLPKRFEDFIQHYGSEELKDMVEYLIF